MATLIAANVGTDGATALANGRKLVRAPSGRLWAVYSKVVEVGLDYYSNVFAAYSDDGGVSWTEEQLTEKDADQQYPSIAVDKNSVVRVVWQGYGWGVNTGWHNIQYRMRTDSWQAQEAVTDAASHQRLPSIAVDEDGYAHVAWEGTGWGENPNDYNIQYRKRTDSWQAQEAVTDVATHQASDGPPSLAVDSDGYVHVVWCDESAEDWNIRYRKRTDSWQTPVNITEEAYDQTWPALCDGLASGYALIWTAHDGTQYDVVFYGALPPLEEHEGTAAISGGGTVAAEGQKQAEATIGISGGGGVTVAGQKSAAGTAAITGGGDVAAEGRKDTQGVAAISGGGGIAVTHAKTARLDSLSIKVSLTRPARIWAIVSEPGKLRAHFNRPERIWARVNEPEQLRISVTQPERICAKLIRTIRR